MTDGHKSVASLALISLGQGLATITAAIPLEAVAQILGTLVTGLAAFFAWDAKRREDRLRREAGEPRRPRAPRRPKNPVTPPPTGGV